MTNKDLQYYLKQFPDDAEIWSHSDDNYEPTTISLVQATALGLKVKNKRWYVQEDFDWSWDHENVPPSDIKIIVI